MAVNQVSEIEEYIVDLQNNFWCTGKNANVKIANIRIFVISIFVSTFFSFLTFAFLSFAFLSVHFSHFCHKELTKMRI